MLICSWHVQQKGALSGKRISDIAGLGLLSGGITQDDLCRPCTSDLRSEEGREDVPEPK